MSIPHKNRWAGFAYGAAIGMLGGLIGLGGAEFRLPFLVGVFHFSALEAVILNKTMTLIDLAFALPFRTSPVPFTKRQVLPHWPVIIKLLAGRTNKAPATIPLHVRCISQLI